MKLTLAQVLVRFLKEAGVRHIFGVSGHSIFDLTDAIYLEPGIDLVSAQIEISAAYMARADSRALSPSGTCTTPCTRRYPTIRWLWRRAALES
jgi:thiamine pyrophosphate-dependent acetolactate synthase large subunit-like protein